MKIHEQVQYQLKDMQCSRQGQGQVDLQSTLQSTKGAGGRKHYKQNSK